MVVWGVEGGLVKLGKRGSLPVAVCVCWVCVCGVCVCVCVCVTDTPQ